MWWLLPIGAGVIGVGVKLLYDAVLEEECEACQRWEEKHEEVERSLEEYQGNIEEHIKHAQRSYDFHFLVNLHFASMKLANSAYQLLNDANTSFNGMSKMLKQAKEQRTDLQGKLKDAEKSKNKKSIYEIIEQLKMVNTIRKNVFADREEINIQRKQFLSEVRKLNNHTKELKELIQERCGNGGQKWYARLEERNRKRQTAGNKQP